MMQTHIKTALALHFCLQFLTNHSTIVWVSALQAAASVTTTAPTPSSWGGWRVALNIGREPFTTMPQSWASTGARFPLVMKCNFTDDGNVASISGDVRYTVALEGEVIKPVQAGSWSLTKNRDLSFSLMFPEQMVRNGVELGPCEIVCESLLYTKKDLDSLDQDFYKSRSVTDEINADVKEVTRRREAPKKWNFETNKWEKRYRDESMVSSVGKRWKQFTAGISEEKQSKKRPKPLELSLEAGQFPGIDCNAYIQKGGLIKIKGRGIIGTWRAEPINDNPASYYRPSY